MLNDRINFLKRHVAARTERRTTLPTWSYSRSLHVVALKYIARLSVSVQTLGATEWCMNSMGVFGYIADPAWPGEPGSIEPV